MGVFSNFSAFVGNMLFGGNKTCSLRTKCLNLIFIIDIYLVHIKYEHTVTYLSITGSGIDPFANSLVLVCLHFTEQKKKVRRIHFEILPRLFMLI